jgi:hypothetical protein
VGPGAGGGLEYLGSRRRGGRDWIVFHNTQPVEDLGRQLTPDDRSRPADRQAPHNVAWDARFTYRPTRFPTCSLDHPHRGLFASGDLRLIRVHRRARAISSRQRVEKLPRAFPVLPSNVFVVP